MFLHIKVCQSSDDRSMDECDRLVMDQLILNYTCGGIDILQNCPRLMQPLELKKCDNSIDIAIVIRPYYALGMCAEN